MPDLQAPGVGPDPQDHPAADPGHGITYQDGVTSPIWSHDALLIPVPSPDTEQFEGLLLMEPREQYDRCIIGVVQRFNDRFVLYDRKCIIDVIVAEIQSDPDYMDEPDYDAQTQAEEHYSFNIVGGYVGEHTPGFLEEEME